MGWGGSADGGLFKQTSIEAGEFWSGLARLIGDFAPRNREFLDIRDRLQEQIDD